MGWGVVFVASQQLSWWCHTQVNTLIRQHGQKLTANSLFVLSASDLQLTMMIKRRNGLNFLLLFCSIFSLLCILDVSSSTRLIPGTTWALESEVSCFNRLTTLLLPWLFILTDVKNDKFWAEIKSASQHSKQHPKCFRNLCFYRTKLSRKSHGDAKKYTVCLELLQQAACV